MRYFLFYLIALNLFWLPVVTTATNCVTQIDIPESECNALVTLFNSTTGAGWYDVFRGNWNVTNTPCSWAGVVCSDGHVIQIDKNANGLDGTLPDLTPLTHLEVLRLGDNQLTGTIDAAKLPASLEELSLSNNQLSGTPDLSALPNLTTVDFKFSLTANKSGQGTVTSSQAGISCGTDCTYVYDFNTVIALTASPAAGSTFVVWSGACSGTGTCQVIMNQVQSVTATFNQLPPNAFALTVNKTGTGNGRVTGNGIDCGSDCSEQYVENTPVTLTAIPSADSTSSTDSTFAGWSGACNGTDVCQVTMTQAQNVTARFTLKTYPLSVSKKGQGVGNITINSIDCGNNCSADYNANTLVTLTAAPAADSLFAGWSGACSGTTPSCQVTMTQAQNVTARFTLKTYPLSVSRKGLGTGNLTGNGIDCGNDCSADYNANTLVTLTAAPATNSLFAGWSGACSGTTLSCQVTMTQAQNVTATFTIKTYRLSVSRKGLGTGNLTGNSIDCGNNCSADYNANTVVVFILN